MTKNQLTTDHDVITSLIALGKITENDVETAKRYAIPLSLRELCLNFAELLSEEGPELIQETQFLADFSGNLAKKWLQFTLSFHKALMTDHKYETISTLIHQMKSTTPQVVQLLNFVFIASDILTFEDLLGCLNQIGEIHAYIPEEPSDVPKEVVDLSTQSVVQE